MNNSAASNGDIAKRLDQLESRFAIIDLTTAYCHGFDNRDFDLFLSIWSEDCVWNIGPPFGSFSGHEGIREAVHDVLWPAWAESHHLSTNHVIEFQGTDEATCVCDVDCIGTLSSGPECQMVGATYRDHVRRREGRWQVVQRDVTMHYFNTVAGTVLQVPGD